MGLILSLMQVRREFKKVLKVKFKTLSHSARVIHFRNLKRLRRFFSKGLNCFVMKGFKFLRKVNLKGKIWLNAEHLGGCAFRFLLRRCLATHRTGCERFA
ncbi:hypothetical protein EGQ49_06030 [Campylobacter upsaliensis]|nr:hypothetical protein [Campylobacter upsaliensis]EAH6028555.1 hypothetical protein [Campylobacter upsaliensis]